MLCSARELLLGEDHDGIIELARRCEGRRAGGEGARPHRSGDRCLDHAQSRRCGQRLWHRARSGGGGPRQAEDGDRSSRWPGKFKSPISIALEFPPEAQDACPIFAGRMMRGVKNGPSPKWVQDRLKAVGLRPISALVDVTNLISLRPRPAAACVRCRQAERQPAGAPGQGRRAAARARRQDLHARCAR